MAYRKKCPSGAHSPPIRKYCEQYTMNAGRASGSSATAVQPGRRCTHQRQQMSASLFGKGWEALPELPCTFWTSRPRRPFFCKRPCRPVKPFAAKGANPFLEDDFLPAVEVHDADTVLFADLRARHVPDEVLTRDGNLLLTGITDRSGHWRYPFFGRQTRSHFFSPRASERSKTVRSN